MTDIFHKSESFPKFRNVISLSLVFWCHISHFPINCVLLCIFVSILVVTIPYRLNLNNTFLILAVSLKSLLKSTISHKNEDFQTKNFCIHLQTGCLYIHKYSTWKLSFRGKLITNLHKFHSFQERNYERTHNYSPLMKFSWRVCSN